MKIHLLVILAITGLSLALYLPGLVEAKLMKRDLGNQPGDFQLQQKKPTIEDFKLNFDPQPQTLEEFESELENLDTQLSKCNDDGKLDIGCYYKGKMAFIQLNDDFENSDLEFEEKSSIKFILRAIINHRFPQLDKIAQETCALKPQISDCIYFNFQSYARAVWDLENNIHTSLFGSLNHDFHESDVENLLLEFKDFELQFKRLDSVSTTEWESEPHFEQSQILMKKCTEYHEAIAAILKSKAVEYWISQPEQRKKAGVIAMIGVYFLNH